MTSQIMTKIFVVFLTLTFLSCNNQDSSKFDANADIKQIEKKDTFPIKELFVDKGDEDGWGCQYCGVTHTGNLLKKIKSVKVEYYLSVCKPDIALIDNDNKVFAVIEVVVTHKPEENVVNFYNDNDIILIQVNLTSDKDIDDLEIKISQPDIVSTCYNPKCKTCGQFQQKKVMTIIDGPCWKCGTTMKLQQYQVAMVGLFVALQTI